MLRSKWYYSELFRKEYKPLIDFIIDELMNEEMGVEVKKRRITSSIDKNLETIKIGQSVIFLTNIFKCMLENGEN